MIAGQVQPLVPTIPANGQISAAYATWMGDLCWRQNLINAIEQLRLSLEEQPPSPFFSLPLTTANDKCCQAMVDRVLGGNKWLTAQKPANCNITVKCAWCSYENMGGWTEPQLPARADGTQNSTITICWSPDTSTATSVQMTLVHEYTHALQLCSKAWTNRREDQLQNAYGDGADGISQCWGMLGLHILHESSDRK